MCKIHRYSLSQLLKGEKFRDSVLQSPLLPPSLLSSAAELSISFFKIHSTSSSSLSSIYESPFSSVFLFVLFCLHLISFSYKHHGVCLRNTCTYCTYPHFKKTTLLFLYSVAPGPRCYYMANLALLMTFTPGHCVFMLPPCFSVRPSIVGCHWTRVYR